MADMHLYQSNIGIEEILDKLFETFVLAPEVNTILAFNLIPIRNTEFYSST